ncbi:MAG: dockerin type I repeat-containing protein, partial [Ruminococcus sp.]|nr:dockerin type I repeat-containing protein [Ruminococcus sp.]
AAAETVVSEITTTAISTQTAEVTLSVSTSDLQTTTVSSTAAEFQKGDLNHDGIVSAADLVYCANYILGNGKTEHSCDINGDGRTDAFDVVEMRKIVISKTVSESE